MPGLFPRPLICLFVCFFAYWQKKRSNFSFWPLRWGWQLLLPQTCSREPKAEPASAPEPFRFKDLAAAAGGGLRFSNSAHLWSSSLGERRLVGSREQPLSKPGRMWEGASGEESWEGRLLVEKEVKGRRLEEPGFLWRFGTAFAGLKTNGQGLFYISKNGALVPLAAGLETASAAFG